MISALSPISAVLTNFTSAASGLAVDAVAFELAMLELVVDAADTAPAEQANAKAAANAREMRIGMLNLVGKAAAALAASP